MFYVSDSAKTYRDHMITEDLRLETVNEWSTALIEATTVTVVNTKYLPKDLIVGGTN